MNRPSILKPAFVIAAGSLLVSGCVVREVRYRDRPPVVVQQGAGPELIVSEAPPPQVVETVTVAPDPIVVWVPGVWLWQGRWVWEAGHWARPPHPGAVWVPHRYVYRGGRHVWIRGGWR